MREYLHYICWIYIFRGTTASQPYIDLTKQVIQPHTDARTRTKSMEKNCLNKYANGYNEKKKWKWHLNEDSPTVGVNTKTWNERWKKDLTIIDVYNTYLLLINARHRMLLWLGVYFSFIQSWLYLSFFITKKWYPFNNVHLFEDLSLLLKFKTLGVKSLFHRNFKKLYEFGMMSVASVHCAAKVISDWNPPQIFDISIFDFSVQILWFRVNILITTAWPL